MTSNQYHTPAPPTFMRLLEPHIVGMNDDCRRFFTTLFAGPFAYTSVRAFVYDLGTKRETIVSRFRRHDLPSVKELIVGALVVRAAHLRLRHSCSRTAVELGVSSANALRRSLLTRIGIGTADLPELFPSTEAAVAWFVARYIEPYREKWYLFTPLTIDTNRSPARKLRVA